MELAEKSKGIQKAPSPWSWKYGFTCKKSLKDVAFAAEETNTPAKNRLASGVIKAKLSTGTNMSIECVQSSGCRSHLLGGTAYGLPRDCHNHLYDSSGYVTVPLDPVRTTERRLVILIEHATRRRELKLKVSASCSHEAEQQNSGEVHLQSIK